MVFTRPRPTAVFAQVYKWENASSWSSLVNETVLLQPLKRQESYPMDVVRNNFLDQHVLRRRVVHAACFSSLLPRGACAPAPPWRMSRLYSLQGRPFHERESRNR